MMIDDDTLKQLLRESLKLKAGNLNDWTTATRH